MHIKIYFLEIIVFYYSALVVKIINISLNKLFYHHNIEIKTAIFVY